MPDLLLQETNGLILLALIATLAGLVRGFSGFGGPAVMTLCLISFYSPLSVISKVAVIDISANLKLLPATRKDVNWKTLRWFIVSSLIFMPVGLFALETLDPAIVKKLVAGIAGAGTLMMLAGWRLKEMPSQWLTVLIGAVAGIIVGATLIAFIAVIYLLMMPASSNETRANIVYWGFPTTLMMVLYHIYQGVVVWDDVWRLALVSILYVGGTILGSRAHKVVSDRNYRRAVLWFLLVLSCVGLFT